MKKCAIAFGLAFCATFAVLGAYDTGRRTAPVIQDAAVRLHRELTQQDEIERLKKGLEAAKAANAELEARPPQVVYDAPELAL